MKRKLLALFVPLFFVFSGYTQMPATWVEIELSKKIVKNLKFEFNPELRLLDDFKMDSYILEGGLSYKLHKYLTIASYYRFEEQWDYKKKSGAYKGDYSYNRLAIDLKPGYDFYRFSLQGRIRYTKGLDATDNASELRYRAKLDYNIKGIKLLPFVSIELFNNKSVTEAEKTLISGGFKDINKIRYTAGLSYELNKNNEVSLFYRLQDNRVKNEWADILGLGFSHDF
jgi:hypothetical protein